MKYSLLILFIYIENILFCQSGIVSYDRFITQSYGDLFVTPYTLYFDNDTSIYVKTGDGKKVTETYKDGDMDKKGRIISSKTIKIKDNSNYYFIDKKNKEIIFKENVAETSYEIQNALYAIDWILVDKKRKSINLIVKWLPPHLEEGITLRGLLSIFL